jgi:hypothetical protein
MPEELNVFVAQKFTEVGLLGYLVEVEQVRVERLDL